MRKFLLSWRLPAAVGLLLLVGFAFWIGPRRSELIYSADGRHEWDTGEAPPRRKVVWEPARPVDLPVKDRESFIAPQWAGLSETIYFTRRGTDGRLHIWSAKVVDGKVGTGSPVAALNSSADDVGPSMSRDGKELYLYSNRAGGHGGFDLYVAKRDGNTWGKPENLGPAVNSAADEYDPAPAPDGKTLYFASSRDSAGAWQSKDWHTTLRAHLISDLPVRFDLYAISRTDGSAWGKARALEAINQADWNEGAPHVSPDGAFLYFASDRPTRAGESRNLDLYRARIEGDDLTHIENLGTGVNTPAHETEPALSNEGFTLVFSRNTGAGADYALFRSTAKEVLERAEWQAGRVAALAAVWPQALLLALVIAVLATIIWWFKEWMFERATAARFVIASLLLHCLVLLWLWGAPIAQEMIRAIAEPEIVNVPPISDTDLMQATGAPSEPFEKTADLAEMASTVDPKLARAAAQQRAELKFDPSTAVLPAQAARSLPVERVINIGPEAKIETEPATSPDRAQRNKPGATVEAIDIQAPAPVDGPRETRVENRVDTARSQADPARRDVTIARSAPRLAPAATVVDPIEQRGEPAPTATPAPRAEIARSEVRNTSAADNTIEAPKIDRADPAPKETTAQAAPVNADRAATVARADAPKVEAAAQGRPAPRAEATDVKAASAAERIAAQTQAAKVARALTTGAAPDAENINAPQAPASAPNTETALNARAVAADRAGAEVRADAPKPASADRAVEPGAQAIEIRTAALDERSTPSQASAKLVRAATGPVEPESNVEAPKLAGPSAPRPEPTVAGAETNVGKQEGSTSGRMVESAKVEVRTTPKVEGQVDRAAHDEVVAPTSAQAKLVNVRGKSNAPVAEEQLDPGSAVAKAAGSARLDPTGAEVSAGRQGRELNVKVETAGGNVAAAPIARAGEVARVEGSDALAVNAATAGPLQRRGSAQVAAADTVEPIAGAPQQVKTPAGEGSAAGAAIGAAVGTERAVATGEAKTVAVAGLAVQTNVRAAGADIERADIGGPTSVSAAVKLQRRGAIGAEVIDGVDVDPAKPVETGRPSNTEPAVAAGASVKTDRTAAQANTTPAAPVIGGLPVRAPARWIAGDIGAARRDVNEAETVLASIAGKPNRAGPRIAAADTIEGTAEIQAMFTLRAPEVRRTVIEEVGGTKKSENSVDKGLRWFASIQNPDGSWSLHSAKSGGSVVSEAGGTGLALLPFLGAGHTHQSGDHQETVGKAVKWLVKNQKADGDLYDGRTPKVHMYSHGIAAIALCEAYGLTRDPALREPAQKAIDFIVKTQNARLGGWRYAPGADTDTSVVGWQVMALKSAEIAGLSVQPKVYEGIRRWLTSVESGPRGGLYSYTGGKATAAMTAQGLLSLQLMGLKRDDPRLLSGAAFLGSNLPKRGVETSYYWYYATQVLYHLGGKAWEDWNPKMRDLLVATQTTQGPFAGSWEAEDARERAGGRICSTALRLLILEVYYRHLPLYRELEK